MKNNEEVVIKPLEVQVVNGNFEDAFRRFKSLVQKENIINEFRAAQSYEKPSEKKRRKSREAAERKFLAETRERQIISGEWDKKQKRKEIKRKQKQDNYKQRQNSQESQD